MKFIIDTKIYSKKIRVYFNETLIQSKQEFEKDFKTTLNVDINAYEALVIYKVEGWSQTPVIVLLSNEYKLLKNIHHETIHVAIHILEKSGIPISYENDETITYLSSYIFEQIVTKLKNEIKDKL